MNINLKYLLPLAILLAIAANGVAQITIPNTFAPNTVISSSQMNANFSEVGTKSLNRQGGTITGNIVVNGGVTIDGADISAFLQPTGKLIVGSSAADAIDVTGGINAGSGNVGIVGADGRVPALTSTYIADLSGTNLTGLSLTSLTDIFAWSLGGDQIEGRTDANYPSGSTGLVLAPATGVFTAPISGNFKLSAVLLSSNGAGTVTLGLFNLTDAPDTEIGAITTTSSTGVFAESGNIALTATKSYGVKIKVTSGSAFAWSVNLKKS
jgi:hypothetical protein